MNRRLSKADEARLVELIQYLNLEEMRSYAATHELDLYICAERTDGSLRRTTDRDRKDVVLKRILDFAVRGERSGPTVYPLSVIAEQPLLARITSRTRVHYKQYEKHNPRFLKAMARLTNGAFRTGMIARIVLRDFWTAGHAPTMRQFADEWSRAQKAHTRPRPEGAYLVDRWRGEAGADWKEIRRSRASQALKMLAKAQRG